MFIRNYCFFQLRFCAFPCNDSQWLFVWKKEKKEMTFFSFSSVVLSAMPFNMTACRWVMHGNHAQLMEQPLHPFCGCTHPHTHTDSCAASRHFRHSLIDSEGWYVMFEPWFKKRYHPVEYISLLGAFIVKTVGGKCKCLFLFVCFVFLIIIVMI